MCCDVDDVGALYLLLAAARKYGFCIGGIAVKDAAGFLLSN